MEAREEQRAKAQNPMEVIEFGRLIDVIPLQQKNAYSSTDVIESGMITVANKG